MNEAFVQHVYILDYIELPDSHIAKNFVECIGTITEEWELPAEGTAPTFVVTDNGRNCFSGSAVIVARHAVLRPHAAVVHQW